jgi:hypothetical protein
MKKVIIEVTFEGDDLDEVDVVVERILDNGVFQDALNEFAQDEGFDLRVEQATHTRTEDE